MVERKLDSLLSEHVIIRTYNQHHYCVVDKKLKLEDERIKKDSDMGKLKITKKELDLRQAELRQIFMADQDILEGYTEPVAINLGKVGQTSFMLLVGLHVKQVVLYRNAKPKTWTTKRKLRNKR